MILEKIFKILENLKLSETLINKVRWSPTRDAIIVDINYGKVLRVCAEKNVVHIQGDNIIGNKLKKMIEGAIKDGN